MGPFAGFLLAMQAAGLVTSYFGYQDQKKTINLGRQLERDQLKTNLAAIRLQSAEGSLDEMKQVRQNLGSQIAANAAAGNRNNFRGISETKSNFNKDERTRRMNLMAKESELRSANILSGLHTAQSETQLGQNLMKDFLNVLPISSAFDSLLNPKKASNNATSNASSTGSSGSSFSWGY